MDEMQEQKTLVEIMSGLKGLMRELTTAERDGIPETMKPGVHYDRKQIGRELDKARYELRLYM